MKLAVIRVRGQVKLAEPIKRTLKELGLNRINTCAIVDDRPEIKGMLEKTKHVTTWGQVDEATLNLLKARGPGPIYRLNPPRKGYGRKGIKIAFTLGGALGDRKEKICDLIKRMI